MTAALLLLAFTLATTAKRADAHLDPVSRRQAADEQRVWERINRNGADEETPHVN